MSGRSEDEGTHSSETLEMTYQTTKCDNAEDQQTTMMFYVQQVNMMLHHVLVLKSFVQAKTRTFG
jgi:hypothetical protein